MRYVCRLPENSTNISDTFITVFDDSLNTENKTTLIVFRNQLHFLNNFKIN